MRPCHIPLYRNATIAFFMFLAFFFRIGHKTDAALVVICLSYFLCVFSLTPRLLCLDAASIMSVSSFQKCLREVTPSETLPGGE